MALSPAAAAVVAGQIITDLGIVGPAAIVALPFWTAIVTRIFAGIATNAVVAGAGPALTAGAVPNVVVGTVS